MNKLPVYYPGSSVVAMFRVRDRGDGRLVRLADYSARAVFYTRLLGQRVRAGTSGPEALPIEPVGEYALRVTLPPEETGRLSRGTCRVRLTLTHNTDGSCLVVSRPIFELKEPLSYES